MKTQLIKIPWIAMAALFAMGTVWAEAQDLSGVTTRDVLLKFRTANAGQMNQIVRNVDRKQMARIIGSMDSQTMSEIARSLDPKTMSEIAKRISRELSRGDHESRVVPPDSGSRLLHSSAGTQIAEARSERLEQQDRAADGRSPEDVQEEQPNLIGVAIITHPSNPVNELTLEQIRKIYAGEYVNWSQVGGPDQQIRVMAVAEMRGVQPGLSSNATVSAFAGNVFMGVAGDSEAIGFVPGMQRRQLRFIGGHDAVRTMAIRDAG